MKKQILQSAKIIILALILGIGTSYISAATWKTAPLSPPADNVEAPINVGSLPQVKTGGLSVDAFVAFLDSVFGGNVTFKQNALFSGKTLFSNDPASTATSSIDSNSGIVNIRSTERNARLIDMRSAWSSGSVTEASMSLDGTGLKFQTTAPDSTTEIDKFVFYTTGARATLVPLLNVQSGGKVIVGDVCIRGSSPEKCLNAVGGTSGTGSIANVGTVLVNSPSDPLGSPKLITINGTSSKTGDNGPAGGYIYNGTTFSIFSLGYNSRGTLTGSWQCASQTATSPGAEGDFCVRKVGSDIMLYTGPNVILTYTIFN